MKKLKYLSLVILLTVTILNGKSFSGTPITLLNIKNFGAKGDGRADDYKAIQDCINNAVKQPHARIVIPFGNYLISQELKIDYTDGIIEIVGEKKLQKNPTLQCTNPTSALSVKGYFSNISSGHFILKNLNIAGNFNARMINKCQLVNGNNWFTGLKITDKKEVFIDNLNVSNIYGEGIYISTTDPESKIASSRFKKVTIQNCNINNCWGYNSKTDSYGDGIYLSDVAYAYIANNQIKNRFLSTGYLGRCGIVIEYTSENCNILNNSIFGYDRAIHVEADYGNHLIKGNHIKGTDLGIIVISQNIVNHNNPLTIIDNEISNEGLAKLKGLNRTYAITSIADRAMIYFYADGDCRKGSLVENNQIKISGNFDFYSNAAVNIRADNITFSHNNLIITQPGKLKYPLTFYNYSNSLLINNKFLGVKLKVKKGTDIDALKKENILSDSKIEFTN
jgi:hypothetical protein